MSEDLDHLPRIDHWIDGKVTAGESERIGAVFDPSSGRPVAAVALASDRDVEVVLASSVAAAAAWAAVPVGRRADVMYAFRRLLSEHTDDLAHLISTQHGKVRGDAIGEVQRGAENVDYACGAPALLHGSFGADASQGVDVHSVRQPVGVAVGITPFNFPVMVPLWMAASAVVCGNAFVLKPSERDPGPSLLLAELFAEAGLPAGVFNVLQGDQSTVEALIGHPSVDALSFVGSTPVARRVYARAGELGKRVQALGGAKNHMVVLPDADVERAADGAVSAAFGSAGERCMAISVVVAVGGVGDELVEAIRPRIVRLNVGPASDPGSEMGPLISSSHLRRVDALVASAEPEGAVVVVDGRSHAPGPTADPAGFFTGPTLVDHVRPGMAVYDEEIFGPVLSVVRVDTLDEALAILNANPYGNGAAIYTRDGGAARRFEREVCCGMVGVNVAIPVPVASFSFGGWKNSLFGNSRMYGAAGIEFFTREKVVTTRWPDPAVSRVDLGFSRG